MVRKRGSFSERTRAVGNALYSSMKSLTRGPRGKSTKKIGPMPDTPSEFIENKKKLQERMWLPGLSADSIDLNTKVLQDMRKKTSATMRTECNLLYGTASSMKGSDSYLFAIAKTPGLLIGVYELSNYADGVLFKRVCDHPVQELLKHRLLPATWPQKYEPFNRFGGSRKLPHGTSVRDVVSAK